MYLFPAQCGECGGTDDDDDDDTDSDDGMSSVGSGGGGGGGNILHWYESQQDNRICQPTR